MRLVQFLHSGRQCLGLEVCIGGDLVNLNKADANLPSDLKTFIELGEDARNKAQSVKDRAGCIIPRHHVTFLAPLTSCEKVLCIGMNYKNHCEELGVPLPIEPVVFSKFPGCIIGPNEDLDFPADVEFLDWEAELAIVIGQRAKHVQVEDAMQYVFGYTAANDITARDWMKRNGGQVSLAKARDQFCPFGPVVVTTDELGDPHDLGIKCMVNGVMKQDGNTNQLIHKTEQIIAHITRFITLKPGDVILTGSPPGIGYCRKPPECLKTGDIVEVAVEKIGTITTKIV